MLKCNIPSFVADFVKVEAWVDSDGGEYLLTDDIGRIKIVILSNIISSLYPNSQSLSASTSMYNALPIKFHYIFQSSINFTKRKY